MITPEGYLDWAIRLDGNPAHVNPGTNPVSGLFFHSAEGYADSLLELATKGSLSWHLSNMMDGRLYQHFPFTARCWHATAANQSYVGMEHEGKVPENPSLTELQIQNDVRVIEDLSAWKHWTPSRPSSPTDTSYTLWEHREVVRIGGSATACPSGRIPWPEIMRRLALADAPTVDEQIRALVALAHFIRNGWNLQDLSDEDKWAAQYAVDQIGVTG